MMNKPQIDAIRKLRAETKFDSVRRFIDHLIEQQFDRPRRS